MMYEGLACTRYNMASRLVDQGRTSPAGDLAKLKDTDASLAETASLGHWWIVLPEDLTDSLNPAVRTQGNLLCVHSSTPSRVSLTLGLSGELEKQVAKVVKAKENIT